MEHSEWQRYTEDLRVAQARSKDVHTNIDYGEIIYTSPFVNYKRWLVAKFENEYNVFTEQDLPGEKPLRTWAACFRDRDRAMAFALKIVLVCSGKITRKDLHTV